MNTSTMTPIAINVTGVILKANGQHHISDT